MDLQLRRETLPEQLADQLVRLIEQQSLAPGDFLPSAAALAETYQVSRTVVREALRMLEARGVIRSENGRGAIIQPISSDLLSAYFQRATALRQESLVELLEVRKGLAVESAALAARRATADELARIQRLVDEMGDCVGQGKKYAELDAQLHVTIASATHNTMLRYLIESIREPLKTTIEAGLRSREKAIHHQRVQELHEELAEALTQRDETRAAAVMALHFDEAVHYIATHEQEAASKKPAARSRRRAETEARSE